MQIKRYQAADMRSALRLIREQQGPDAVILSTRPLAQGVEVCSAVDLDLAGGQGTLAEVAELKRLERTVRRQEPDPSRAAPEAGQEWATVAPDGSADEAQGSVSAELRSLRELLEQQLAALAWNDFTRREPLKARALGELTQLGLHRELSLQIMADLPADMPAGSTERLGYALLARRLATCSLPGEQGGVVALIGPAGSGKTATLSKLAARWVLEHSPESLAIICADEERLGSLEQLRTLGRLLGVSVARAASPEQLATRLEALRGTARLILIDTPGASMRDGAIAVHYRALRERCEALQTVLVVPVSAQAGVIEDAFAHLAPVSTSCALTRLDEAISLGGALSALIGAHLPLACCCDGPRIPEDLHPARAHQLVARAVELSRHAHIRADDELLARRYGKDLHAAA